MRALLLTLLLPLHLHAQQIAPTWTVERANDWYDELGWVSGSNFNPSSSVNQLEMWQAATFDSAGIERELGYAEEVGFNIMRVYLHYLPWEADAEGFKRRIDTYLDIADRHGIATMFVLFDNCWYGDAELGEQPEPIPGLHNSGWLQCPRYAEVFDTTRWGVLEAYTRDIIDAYRDDERVAIWDLYNEPGANHRPYQITPLLTEVIRWAREEDPSQPLTMGLWVHSERQHPGMMPLMDLMRANSDVITFHQYGSLEDLKQRVSDYASFGRPLIVTEYLARGNANHFATHLPFMREHNVGAINWGLVTGKTQTMYAWGSPLGAPEPELWHHDIFRADGTPFAAEEVEVIRAVNAGETVDYLRAAPVTKRRR